MLRAPAKGEGARQGAWLTRRVGTSRPGRWTGGQTCKPTAQIMRSAILARRIYLWVSFVFCHVRATCCRN